jgi:hypothetical protein
MHSQYAYYIAGAAKTEAGGKAPKTDPDPASCWCKVLGKTAKLTELQKCGSQGVFLTFLCAHGRIGIRTNDYVLGSVQIITDPEGTKTYGFKGSRTRQNKMTLYSFGMVHVVLILDMRLKN